VTGELEQIVQRMIDAGEPEEHIAAVIQGYTPPEAPIGSIDRDRQYLADSAQTSAGDVLRSIPGALPELAAGAVLGGAGRLLTKLPVGRLAGAVGAGAKAGAQEIPFVGPPLRAGIKAAGEAWKASAPKAAPKVPAAVTAAAGPKPKLKAHEVAAQLRTHYGSEKAGRMLYGQARPGVKAADRTAAIKRLAPGESQLPDAAKRAIARELASSTPEEAFAYASKAPNARAEAHFGDLLRQVILQRSGR